MIQESFSLGLKTTKKPKPGTSLVPLKPCVISYTCIKFSCLNLSRDINYQKKLFQKTSILKPSISWTSGPYFFPFESNIFSRIIFASFWKTFSIDFVPPPLLGGSEVISLRIKIFIIKIFLKNLLLYKALVEVHFLLHQILVVAVDLVAVVVL